MTRELFETRVLPLQNKLFRYAISIVAGRELAKDIVQEVLIKLWNQREQLDQINHLESWAVRLTRNKALDKLRLRANQTVALKLVDDEPAFHITPDKSVEQQNLIDAIHDLLETLPEKQREIFNLRDLQGYSNQEIEKMLNLDANQVKVYLFRARKKIRSKLNLLINYGLENEKTAS